MKDSGTYQVSWNGEDESGSEVSSGVYFYQVKTEQFSAKKKMLLVR
jgi:flagellar hook assembly protein FlgD